MNIKVDLSDFYQDDKKLIMLYIDLDIYCTIQDVIGYICEQSELERHVNIEDHCESHTVSLFVNEFYIPPKQSSDILKEVHDVLKLKRRSEKPRILADAEVDVKTIADDNQKHKKKKARHKAIELRILNDIDKADVASVDIKSSVLNTETVTGYAEPMLMTKSDNQYQTCFEDEVSTTSALLKRKKKKSYINATNEGNSDILCMTKENNLDGDAKNLNTLRCARKRRTYVGGSAAAEMLVSGSVAPDVLVRDIREPKNLLATVIKSKNLSFLDKETTNQLYSISKRKNSLYDDTESQSPINGDTEPNSSLRDNAEPTNLACSVNESANLISCSNKTNLPCGKESDNTGIGINLNCTADFMTPDTFESVSAIKRKRNRKHNKKKKNDFNLIHKKQSSNSYIESENFIEEHTDIINPINSRNHILFSSDEEGENCTTAAKSDVCIQSYKDSINHVEEKQNIHVVANHNCSVQSRRDEYSSIVETTTPLIDSNITNETVKISLNKTYNNAAVNITTDNACTFSKLLKLQNNKYVSVFERRSLKEERNKRPKNPYLCNKDVLSKELVLLHSPPESACNTKHKDSDILTEKFQSFSALLMIENARYPHIYHRRKLLSSNDHNLISKGQDLTSEGHNLTSEGHNLKTSKGYNETNVHLTKNVSLGESNCNALSSNLHCSLRGKDENSHAFTTNANSEDSQFTNMEKLHELEHKLVSAPDLDISHTAISNETTSFVTELTVDNQEQDDKKEQSLQFLGVRPQRSNGWKYFHSIGNVIKSLANSHKTDTDGSYNSLNTYTGEINGHSETNGEEVMVEETDTQDAININESTSATGICVHQTFCEENVDMKEEFIGTELLPEISTELEQNRPGDLRREFDLDRMKMFYESCPLLPALPVTGDIIAAKVMTLDETFCPCFSDYRPARVVAVEGLKLSLYFLDDGDISPDTVSQNWKGAAGIKNQQETLDWRDLKDVRLLYP